LQNNDILAICFAQEVWLVIGGGIALGLVPVLMLWAMLYLPWQINTVLSLIYVALWGTFGGLVHWKLTHRGG